MWLNGFHDLNNLISLWKWPSPGKSTVLCGRWVALGGEWVKGEEITNCKINNFHVSCQSLLKSYVLSKRFFSIIYSARRTTQVISWAMVIEPRKRSTYTWPIDFYKMPKLFNGKGIVFSTYSAETTGYLYRKKMNLNSYLTPHRKINLRCVIDLRIEEQ